MIVYRISRKVFKDDLKGTGAEKYGGRWNNIGVPVLYTAEHLSLCILEFAVHTSLSMLPADLYITEIELPEDKNAVHFEGGLPYDWRHVPHNNATQLYGDEFVKASKYLALKVPSVVVPKEFNLLINPRHDLAEKIRIVHSYPFNFDKRLFQ